MSNLRKLYSIVLFNLLLGCSSYNNPQDPLEGFNRFVFGFNMLLNDVILEPSGRMYDAIIPEFFQDRVSDALTTVRMPFAGVSYLLLLDGDNFARSILSFVINVVFGFFGTVDVAGKIGVAPKMINGEDILKGYGAKTGHYVMLPIFGPSTPRAIFGKMLGFWDPSYSCIGSVRWRNRIYAGTAALDQVSYKAKSYKMEKDMRKDSPDFYVTVRSVYMQKANGEQNTEDFYVDESDL